jgi:hypothetical protein
LNSTFRKMRYPYRAMRYKGDKQFQPDAQPHSKLCDCRPCNLYRAYVAANNPDRLDDNGNVMQAERKPKPVKGIKVTDDMLRRSRNGIAVIKWRGF